MVLLTERRIPQRLSPLWDGKWLLFLAGIAVTLGISALHLIRPLILRQAELRLHDLIQIHPAPRSVVQPPILIGIDEEALAAYGQWPWPRYRIARLVERLNALGAKVVVLDVMMPEPDRTSPGVILRERRRDGEDRLPPGGEEGNDINSRRLAEALSRGKSVIGCFLEFSEPSARGADVGEPVLPGGTRVQADAEAIRDLPAPRRVIRSIGLLTGAVSAEGFTNALHDCDGVLRRTPLLLPFNGKLCPSLALAALLMTTNDRSLRLGGRGGEKFLEWHGTRIPLDRGGNMLIRFGEGDRQVRYHSARQILEGGLPPGSLEGKVVLVGVWGRGLGDLHLTPDGRSLPGVAIHGAVISTILAKGFLARPGWGDGAELAVILLLGIICTTALSRGGMTLSLAVVACGTTLSLWGARFLMSQGVSLSPLLPALTPVSLMSVLGVLRYGIEAHNLRRRTRDLIEAQDTIIVSMSALTEARDRETGGHIERTRRYVEILARELARQPGQESLDETSIELLAKSAPLHDIGKVGIPDEILHKEGELTEGEYEIMKGHTMIGADALARTISASGHPDSNGFLRYAREMVSSHHERWDGSGYPFGLAGEEIPLAGRLMAVADVYDALTSRRVYKEAFSHAEARDFIIRKSGSMFDPAVVRAFERREDDFRRISEEFADAPAELRHDGTDPQSLPSRRPESSSRV